MNKLPLPTEVNKITTPIKALKIIFIYFDIKNDIFIISVFA
jgi:hypothetical protein